MVSAVTAVDVPQAGPGSEWGVLRCVLQQAGGGGGGGGGGVPFPTNGRPFTSGLRTTSQSVIKRQKVNQGDAPNPVVFVATKDTR